MTSLSLKIENRYLKRFWTFWSNFLHHYPKMKGENVTMNNVIVCFWILWNCAILESCHIRIHHQSTKVSFWKDCTWASLILWSVWITVELKKNILGLKFKHAVTFIRYSKLLHNLLAVYEINDISNICYVTFTFIYCYKYSHFLTHVDLSL